LLGPFKEEEEGIGIGSDVVKVKGEDPTTPRLLSERENLGCIRGA